jgi:hypothetical protein
MFCMNKLPSKFKKCDSLFTFATGLNCNHLKSGKLPI